MHQPAGQQRDEKIRGQISTSIKKLAPLTRNADITKLKSRDALASNKRDMRDSTIQLNWTSSKQKSSEKPCPNQATYKLSSSGFENHLAGESHLKPNT